MGSEENEIAKQIVDYCAINHYPITRHQTGRKGGIQLGQPFWPDFMAAIKGIGNVLIEVKRPGGDLSVGQTQRIAEIRANDGAVIVADSLNVFVAQIERLQGKQKDFRMKY